MAFGTPYGLQPSDWLPTASVAEGAMVAVEQSIAQNGTQPAMVKKNGLDKFIPFFIILAVLYFVWK